MYCREDLVWTGDHLVKLEEEKINSKLESKVSLILFVMKLNLQLNIFVFLGLALLIHCLDLIELSIL